MPNSISSSSLLKSWKLTVSAKNLVLTLIRIWTWAIYDMLNAVNHLGSVWLELKKKKVQTVCIYAIMYFNGKIHWIIINLISCGMLKYHCSNEEGFSIMV